ncbi:MAG TPA: PfkB family carbohydrate kinase [Acidobacteriaceae bacterium]|nr:PfkB family carbohydrate kinase [Acidobacteriaceae bacterium]
MRVLGIGEVVWDVFPDRELLGGAALNFCVNTLRLGDHANLITAVGSDLRGLTALDAMRSFGVDTEFVAVTQELPTGAAFVSRDANGDPHFDIPRPAAFDRAGLSPRTFETAVGLWPDWLYFGTLMQMEPSVEELTQRLMDSLPGVRGFYDMNLRPGNWTPPLVERLCHLATVLKLNESEAETLGPFADFSLASFTLAKFCKRWAARYNIDTICVTRGGDGCFVYHKGKIHEAPGYRTVVADTVGAGDAFAAAFLHGYHRNWPIERTALFGNALGSIVASRPGAIPEWTLEECLGLAAKDGSAG